ncbi:MAG TPA: GvpL/GvpF family gas vesicle protein [Gemmatimonadaceae bacterium]|jgi:hypothetical protein
MAHASIHQLIAGFMSSSNPIWYVYGIVPASTAMSTLPVGLDETAVALETVDGIGALVSALDAEPYGATAMETNSADLEWLGPRAVAHDLVLTRASDAAAGAVVPLPMFSLFTSRDAVRAMLGERASQLASTLQRVSEGREFALRVYRVDAELMESMTALSPRLAELAQSAQAAAAGQRYLLERKLAAEKKSELRVVSQQVIDEIVSELTRSAVKHVRSAIPRASDADTAASGTMVLNAAFLVAPGALAEFQRTLTALVERHDRHGFRFDFTGPWPPYHFVGEER